MRTRIWVALIALYIVWGSTYLAIRFAVETIPPFLMAGVRFLLSGAMLYGWRRWAGDPAPTRPQWRSAVIIGALLLLGGNGLVSWAEQHVDSGIAALVIASIPFWMVLIEALRPHGTRPDGRIILGLLMGFGGIALLVRSAGGASAETGLDLIGLAVLLLAALIWSSGSIYGRRAEMPASTLLGTGMEMLGGAGALFVAATVAGEWHGFRLTHVSTGSLAGLVYLILVGSLIGFVSYSWLLRNAPIPLVSTYAYVNPIVAIFLGSWIGDEVITGEILMAALMIIAAVAVINLSKQTRSANAQESRPVHPAAPPEQLTQQRSEGDRSI